MTRFQRSDPMSILDMIPWRRSQTHPAHERPTGLLTTNDIVGGVVAPGRCRS